ncbi:MAG: hypothetical protein LBB09_03820 [Rickettsiales bacterium]|nr:hypothetical protein [Rickettsiales bacterium]
MESTIIKQQFKKKLLIFDDSNDRKEGRQENGSCMLKAVYDNFKGEGASLKINECCAELKNKIKKEDNLKTIIDKCLGHIKLNRSTFSSHPLTCPVPFSLPSASMPLSTYLTYLTYINNSSISFNNGVLMSQSGYSGYNFPYSYPSPLSPNHTFVSSTSSFQPNASAHPFVPRSKILEWMNGANKSLGESTSLCDNAQNGK